MYCDRSTALDIMVNCTKMVNSEVTLPTKSYIAKFAVSKQKKSRITLEFQTQVNSASGQINVAKITLGDAKKTN